MAKRGTEPDEAIDPTLDGFADPPEKRTQDNLFAPLAEEPETETPAEEVTPAAIVLGDDETALATARMARECGFDVKIVVKTDPLNLGERPEIAEELANFDNFVEDCGVDGDSFVCVFLDDEDDAAAVLEQCLASEAFYIGVAADKERRARLYEIMRARGFPDAELAAINCPIGLNVGADTPERKAAAAVVEMLAARNGTLNKLLYAD